MKPDATLLLENASDSLVLSIRLFSRRRVSGNLIWFDHAFAMPLKAAVLHWGGRIRATLLDTKAKANA